MGFGALLHRLSEKQMMMMLAAIVGLLAGIGTYVFERLLHLIVSGLTGWFNVESENYLYLVYPAAGIILASLFVKYIVKDNISEGVTRVLYAIGKKGSRIKPHNCYSSVVGGAITIGFGGSVGPEAPIVLTGSAIGSNVSRLLRLNYRQTTMLLGCGAAAAVSAIFKAPIAGLIFVLEVLMLDISMAAIVPLLISSVVGTTIALLFKGFGPMLDVNVGGMFRIDHLHFYLMLAVLCGLVAFYFTSVNSRISRLYGRLKSPVSKWIWGGVTLGVLIFLFPPLYGEGYESFTLLMHGHIDELFNNSLFYRYRDIPWVAILFLAGTLFFKVIAMASTNAAGGVGGTFAPSLFVGAFTGGTMALICNTYFGMDLSVVNFSLVGMAGVMTGVMKAPLTSIFLIAELSSGYGLFVPLMLVASVSFAISYYFDPDSIYTKKLRMNRELVTHNKDTSVMVFLKLDKLIETDFHVLTKYDALGYVVQLVAQGTHNIFPVTGRDGELVGVVDINSLRGDMFDQSKYYVTMANYMKPPADMILQNEMITEVLNKFERSGAGVLPVVDKNNHYVGFVSKSRILEAYRHKLVELSQE